MKTSPKLIAFVRKLLLALACLATLAALFVVVENWRGDRAWRALQEDFARRGARLDQAAFQSPPVPTERDIFKAPLLADLIAKDSASSIRAKKIRDTAQLNRLEPFFDVVAGPTIDPGALREKMKKAGLIATASSENPAVDVLGAFAPAAELLDSVCRAARERDSASATIDFSTAPSGISLGALFDVGRLLVFRARMELAAGKADAALADTFAALRLGRSCTASSPKSVLSLLIGQALASHATQPMHDAIPIHAWNERQFAALQQQLEGFQSLRDLAETIRVERVWALAFIDAAPSLGSRISGVDWPWWMIHGWVQQNKVAYATAIEEQVLSLFSPADERIFPERIDAMSRIPLEVRPSRSPYRWLGNMTLARLPDFVRATGATANDIEQAALVCALERYRLDHGAYPEKLESLVPAYCARLPRDTTDGASFLYRTLADGSRQLEVSGQEPGAKNSGHFTPTVWALPAGA
ncbi:MAG TPA: hypothetical protein VHD62_03085 [Opitutaceae bacterium]|nr:hypothetical protein [Opitutaceae bacterium]